MIKHMFDSYINHIPHDMCINRTFVVDKEITVKEFVEYILDKNDMHFGHIYITFNDTFDNVFDISVIYDEGLVYKNGKILSISNNLLVNFDKYIVIKAYARGLFYCYDYGLIVKEKDE